MDPEIHFIKAYDVLSSDSGASQKFMHGLRVHIAKNYIDNLSEETRKSMLEKAEEGIWPSFAPLGYRNIEGPNGKRVIAPDPQVAPIIIRLFKWYASGNYSLREVTKMAQAAGIVFRGSENPVPTATVHAILRNSIYTGDFSWKGKRYRAIHAPLITHDLWDHVQKILDDRSRTRHRKVKHDFAVSGFIACGHCGYSLVGEIKKQRYVYYHCTAYKGKCPEPYVREEVLEERFAEVLKGLRFDAGHLPATI